MGEYIRGVDIHVEVDTNKRTTVLANGQGVDIPEAVRMLRAAADELEGEQS